jgi:hypothetical protein
LRWTFEDCDAAGDQAFATEDARLFHVSNHRVRQSRIELMAAQFDLAPPFRLPGLAGAIFNPDLVLGQRLFDLG